MNCGESTQFKLTQHQLGQILEQSHLAGAEVARQPVDHAQGAQVVAVTTLQRCACVEAHLWVLSHQGIGAETRV